MSSDIDLSDTSIYDEIYGYVRLTELELKIIDTPLFQRLNEIKQLGMAYRVFPGAQHTRFSHSIGVLHIIDKIASSLHLESELKEKMRLVALLHDIGHYPFSHTTEVVYTNHNQYEKGKHERFSAHVITNTSLKDILKEKYSNEEIVEISKIINGESDKILLNQMITSELDADRLDYLMRDSYHTGVTYGNIDIDRIMLTFDKDENNYICIKEGGKHAAEGYLISRYLMWATVYTHKTIAGFDEIVQHLLPLIVESKYSNFEELMKCNEDDIIKYTDSYVFNKIHENKDNANSYISKLCSMFLSRTHLELVKQINLIPENKQIAKNYYTLDSLQKIETMSDFTNKYGLDPNWIFHNNSSTQMPTLKPLIEKMIERQEPKGREMQKILRIKNDGQTSNPLLQDPSSLVYNLQGFSLDISRIFCESTIVEPLQEALTKFLA